MQISSFLVLLALEVVQPCVGIGIHALFFITDDNYPLKTIFKEGTFKVKYVKRFSASCGCSCKPNQAAPFVREKFEAKNVIWNLKKSQL